MGSVLDILNGEFNKVGAPMWLTFKPRPDQPEKYDQQTAFYNSKHSGLTHLLGGNGSGTTTLALAKMIKFVLYDQEAPRPDTPFWVMSETQNMVSKVCAKEKLIDRGLLPKSEVDWHRIHWYREKEGLPYTIPLKPRPGSKTNWVLEFKSYGEGRQALQAASIGGFLFVEQYPWELLDEVMARTRDYSFPGSKLAECTPIDPVRSLRLEQMIAENKMPEGWAVYRCNTECGVEYGHVSKEWFDQFYGMLTPEMRLVRTIGAFASFAGVVYPNFNRHVHVVDGLANLIRHNYCIHKRAIDWGSGPDNAMVCLWGAKDPTGVWMIYREYYSTDQEYTYDDHAEEIVNASEEYNEIDPAMIRSTYADPAAPGLMRLFAKNGVHCEPARNDVHDGINIVKAKFETRKDGRPGILIDSGCKNLIRELTGYRWEKPRTNSVNPKNAKPVPLKKDDHACVGAGTPVLMADGTEKPIEQVVVGDLVQTHLGLAKVEAIRSRLANTVTLTIEGHQAMIVSEDHSVYSRGEWCRAITLKKNQLLSCLKVESFAKRLHEQDALFTWWNGEVRSIVPILTEVSQIDILCHFTAAMVSLAESNCIKRSGDRQQVDQFVMDIASIIETAISGIIERTILSRLATQSTVDFILRRWRKLGTEQEDGISLLKEESGIDSMRLRLLRDKWRDLQGASNAAKSINQNFQSDFVQELAGTWQELRQAWMTKFVSANDVEKVFELIDTARKSIAVMRAARVLDIKECGHQEVFSICTMYGSYVAGGLIHKNCDALRYLLATDAYASEENFVAANSMKPKHRRRYLG